MPRSRLALVLALLSATATLRAQDRLFLGTREIDLVGTPGAPLGSAPNDVQGKPAAGGRYLAYLSWVLDTLTGIRSDVPTGTWILEADPTRPRAFVYDGATVSVFDLETRALTPVVTAAHPYPRGFVSASYASDTDELFVRRRGADDSSAEIAVVAVASRQVTRVLPAIWEGEWDWHVTAAGDVVVAMVFGDVQGGTYTQGVHLLDARTGARVAAHAAEVSNVLDDRRFRRTYVLGRGALSALDRQGHELARVPMPLLCYPRMALSPHSDRLYVVWTTPPTLTQNYRYVLTTYDVAQGRALSTVDVTAAVGIEPTGSFCNAPLVSVLSPPPAPTVPAATVSGASVTLAWSATVGATSYVVEAGVAPGRTDVSMPSTDTSLTVTAVPPGRYVVRVRAVNRFGTGRASSEITVEVP